MRLLFIILLLPTLAFSQRNFRPSAAKQLELDQRRNDESVKKEKIRYKNFKFPPLQQAIIDRCNTGVNASYLSDNEKEFILLHNLARTNPEFFRTYVSLQYDSSLTNKLPQLTASTRNLLKPDKGLFQSAKVHAISSGKKGTTGHQNLDKRILKYNYHLVKKEKRFYGENCSYGEPSVIERFISLLNSPKHFENMMTPLYNSIGVSQQPHIKYSSNIVADFANK